MASWACSISDSFIEDASIRWYVFHLTKYFRSCPLNCVHLNTACTSNSNSLLMGSSGGLKASRTTDFKSET